MAKLGINTGTAPNDGTGDTLLNASVKIKSNFDEIYLAFGDGNNLVSYAKTSGISTVAQGLTGTPNITVGVITATKYFGDGSSLTGITAAAGVGIGIKTSAGLVGTGATILDFRGSGISTVTVASGIATINITGSSSTPDISPVMMSMIF